MLKSNETERSNFFFAQASAFRIVFVQSPKMLSLYTCACANTVDVFYFLMLMLSCREAPKLCFNITAIL